MLVTDREIFRAEFPAALAFKLAADLRKEAYTLGRIPPSVRQPWENARLRELMENAPACQKRWFVDQFENDCYAVTKEGEPSSLTPS